MYERRRNYLRQLHMFLPLQFNLVNSHVSCGAQDNSDECDVWWFSTSVVIGYASNMGAWESLTFGQPQCIRYRGETSVYETVRTSDTTVHVLVTVEWSVKNVEIEPSQRPYRTWDLHSELNVVLPVVNAPCVPNLFVSQFFIGGFISLSGVCVDCTWSSERHLPLLFLEMRALKSGLREKNVLQLSFMRWASIVHSTIAAEVPEEQSWCVDWHHQDIRSHLLVHISSVFFHVSLDVSTMALRCVICCFFVQALSILGYDADAAAESRSVHLWCSCFKSPANQWQRCWMCVLSRTLEEVMIHLNFRLINGRRLWKWIVSS